MTSLSPPTPRAWWSAWHGKAGDVMSYPDGLDQMRVSGIRGYGYHGLLAPERELGQMFVADVCLGLDLGPAARDGELSYSVDYAGLAARVHAVLTGEPCDPIETLGLR